MHLNLTNTKPFGLEVDATIRLADFSLSEIGEWIAEHRIVVLRGVPTPTDDEMLTFCDGLGEVMEWEFGAFNELRVNANAKNYLYTNRQVPFHWDGAFAGRIPHLIFFYCQEAMASASAGGETIFCDTVQLLHSIDEEERRRFEDIEITYSTQKIAHYGGTFTSPLIVAHPMTGDATLRYAEPVNDVNPVTLKVTGLSSTQQAGFCARMKCLLYDSAFCYAHTWRTGDIALGDNHALLHGRRAFLKADYRHLRRVNIL